MKLKKKMKMIHKIYNYDCKSDERLRVVSEVFPLFLGLDTFLPPVV
jgi:hypothetical protein